MQGGGEDLAVERWKREGGLGRRWWGSGGDV